MKGKFGWIIGTIETIIGFIFFIISQVEVSSNSGYTWSKPYSTYEAQVIMLKWIGIILFISGIFWFILNLCQSSYTNKHTQEVNKITKKGGVLKCSNCGLTFTASTKQCPRCGKSANH